MTGPFLSSEVDFDFICGELEFAPSTTLPLDYVQQFVLTFMGLVRTAIGIRLQLTTYQFERGMRILEVGVISSPLPAAATGSAGFAIWMNLSNFPTARTRHFFFRPKRAAGYGGTLKHSTAIQNECQHFVEPRVCGNVGLPAPFSYYWPSR